MGDVKDFEKNDSVLIDEKKGTGFYKSVFFYVKASFFLVGIFIVLSICIILPVYLLSEYSPKLYSLIVVFLLTAVILYYFIAGVIKTYKRYGNYRDVLGEMCIVRILPVAIVVIAITLEAMVYRTSFFVSFLFFLLIELVFNGVLIIFILFVMNKRNSYKIKLKKSIS